MASRGSSLSPLHQFYSAPEARFAVDVAAFWREVEAVIPHFYRPEKTHSPPSASVPKIYSAAAERLTSLCDGLYLALGVQDDAPEIIITANGNPHLFASASKIVSLAPLSLTSRAAIYALRPARSEVQAVNLPGLTLRAGDILYAAEIFDDYTDMHLFIPGFTKACRKKRNELTGGVFLLLDYLLGEYFVATNLRRISPRAYELAPKSARPLALVPQHLVSSAC